MLEGKFSLAYEKYHQNFKKDLSNNYLHFKLAEAALFAGKLDLARDHLDKLKPFIQKETPLALKSNYLQCVIARMQKNWLEVEKILSTFKFSAKNLIIKPNCLIHGLIEMEKTQFYLHHCQLAKAFKHLQLAKTIITNRYGVLHPFTLPIYELFYNHLDPSKIAEKQFYLDKITRIQQLFPKCKWQGALNAHLLD